MSVENLQSKRKKPENNFKKMKEKNYTRKKGKNEIQCHKQSYGWQVDTSKYGYFH